ncbi:hypothetical protein F2P81_002761 [Scophthalmus maximus]|uniref:Uncharacterized protein n=1 Tax=Scophthalmus maximus TaxID=52904 RepID=A0A6A4TW10_SCOMX|nr:hypothetical protein F2P81_002761 [Scophthalmus maximus]
MLRQGRMTTSRPKDSATWREGADPRFDIGKEMQRATRPVSGNNPALAIAGDRLTINDVSEAAMGLGERVELRKEKIKKNQITMEMSRLNLGTASPLLLLLHSSSSSSSPPRDRCAPNPPTREVDPSPEKQHDMISSSSVYGKATAISPLDVSVSDECGLLQTRRSQLGGFVDAERACEGP